MNEPIPEFRPRHPSASPVGRGLIRFVCNSNPFYAISAVLVLLGLRTSYDPQAASFPTWALLSGLAAYTMLLAGMACFLVRRGGVWEDVRTLVLLVTVVLLAMPAFFDDILASDPRLGIACELGGFVFAVAVSEALLRGLALRFPIGFRVPYHLTLALFFLHPVALTPLLRHPDDPAVMWALFAFPFLAGTVALTLIPAARRGAAYVAKNGSPWPWPLYPWSLFVLMSVCVCARSFSLCLAINYSGGTTGHEGIDTTIFGPYFLVPFGLAIAALLLEAGIAARSRSVSITSLLIPMALVGLSAIGHRPDAAYRRFLWLFVEGTGATPMFVALTVAIVFYAVAALRRVGGALDALSLSVLAMVVVGPETMDFDGLTMPRALPLIGASAFQFGLAATRHSSWRALLGTICLTAATVIGPVGSLDASARSVAAFHVGLSGVMMIGAVGQGALSRCLRGFSAVMLVMAAVVPICGATMRPVNEWMRLYPILPILASVAYGRLVGGRMFYVASAVGLACWSAVSGVSVYAALRRSIMGLDQIVMGLLFFLIAAVISLGKAGDRTGRSLWQQAVSVLVRRGQGARLDALDEGLGEIHTPS